MILYISDLDGTLLNKEKKIKKESFEIINNLIEHGLNFTIATARSYHTAWPLIKDISFKLPMIFHNGSYIYSSIEKKTIHAELFNPSVYKKVLDTFISNNNSPFVYTGEKNNFRVIYPAIENEGQRIYLEDRCEDKDIRFKGPENYSQVITTDVPTILGIGEKDILDVIFEKLKMISDINIRYDKEMYTGWYWLEATSINADKAHAIRYFKEKMHFDKVICFGDAKNDINMFKEADVSIAVSNASDEVKAEADFVINNDDSLGVVKYLQKQFK